MSAELFAALPAKHLAVLVIDVQLGLFETDPAPFEALQVIERINRVTAKARAARVPVIFVRHDGPLDPAWTDPRGWEFHPKLEVNKNETVLHKTTGDAFYQTGLEEKLRAGGVQSLLLMGYATDFCIDATLRNAVSKNFEVFVVSDAHTTNDAPHLKAAAIRQHFNWVWSDSPSTRGIHLLNASEVEFRPSS